jgi:bifunctional UDP-N-acetylglucosamine pyrophosphorylase/glucosamine-1-phosphate N-acetyltransferase
VASNLDILILAAGRGTRMHSDRPKVLHTLMGDPLVLHVLDGARELRPREVGVIVGHGAAEVRAALSKQDVTFCRQREQKGTGHAVRSAARAFSGRSGHVMVLSGDVPLIRGATLKKFFEDHKKSRAGISLITASMDAPGSLGRISRDERGNVVGIVEARDAEFAELAIREVNSGIYLFRNSVLFNGLKEIRPNKGSGEIYLTDLIQLHAAAGKRINAVNIGDPSEVMGINTGAELITAQAVLRNHIVMHHAAKGVEFVDPASTFVAKGARIGRGTVVWPFSVIMGGVSIGARCRIGPFAHLRGGTEVGDDSQVGNFVEMKNTVLGPESLALHLAYLGDATIGAGVNLGAGTITANFDGHRKQSTSIDDGASIGAGTVLVAPVAVGAKARTAAGSVVLSGDDVEAGGLVAGVPAAKKKTRRVVKRAQKKRK